MDTDHTRRLKPEELTPEQLAAIDEAAARLKRRWERSFAEQAPIPEPTPEDIKRFLKRVEERSGAPIPESKPEDIKRMREMLEARSGPPIPEPTPEDIKRTLKALKAQANEKLPPIRTKMQAAKGNLADVPRFEAITERDIDVLLMEELVSDSGFLEWFVGRTTGWSTMPHQSPEVRHSVSNEHGESDLIVLMYGPGGEMQALLIENKLNAPAQPDQAARYRRRGEIGLQNGDWHQYVTCLAAPARYLGASANAAGYQATVGYEDIAEWMQANLPAGPRRDFKHQLIVDAIEQQRRGYSPKVDPVVTRFFTEYWEFSESLFPELRFSHVPQRAGGSTWAEFRPHLAAKGRHIIHKVPEGCVDLQISGFGLRVEELKRLNPALIASGLQFVRTQKSASLRAEVPKMNSREDFSSQRESALVALKAAFRLMSLSHLISLPAEVDK